MIKFQIKAYKENTSKKYLEIQKQNNEKQVVETRLQMLENEKIQSIDNNEDKQLEEGESSQLFVNHITKMITKKWYIKVNFFINLIFIKSF